MNRNAHRQAIEAKRAGYAPEEPTTADDVRLAEVAQESATEYAQRRARENEAQARALDLQHLDVIRAKGL